MLWDSAVTSEMQGVYCGTDAGAGSVEKVERWRKQTGKRVPPPTANIQQLRGDLLRGVGRALETCAIFHHYADTMVGLAGFYVLLFLLALLPTSHP